LYNVENFATLSTFCLLLSTPLFYVLCSNLVGKRQEVKGKRIRISAVSRQLSELIAILIHKS